MNSLDANVSRFEGIADLYDEHRPVPPAILVDLLTQLAGVSRPGLVVDLGSGSGLSTRLWADRADQVIGIEPGEDMRRAAAGRTAAPNVRYLPGFGHATGLPDGGADIVTASQALHWMEPEPTFAEVARILRPGGVFAAIDCDWPPAMHWEAEVAFEACLERCDTIGRARGFTRDVSKWAKHEHLTRMRASGRFRYVRELTLHNVEAGHATRLVGLALSQGQVATVLKHGVSEAEAGIVHLRAVAARTLGDEPRPWYFSYRVRIGIV